MSLYNHTARILGRVLLNHARKINVQETRNIKRYIAPTLKELYRRRVKLGPEPEAPRSQMLEWNYEAEMFAFGKRLGEDFNKDILRQALTHRAYATLEADKRKSQGVENVEIASNEDLIQQGADIISHYLKDVFTNKYPEGAVAALTTYLTGDKMLAHVASHMGLKDLILTPEFPVAEATLAATFKAVVAALAKSQNLERSQLFINDFLVCHLHDKEIFDLWDLEEPYKHLEGVFGAEIEPRICNQSAVNTILANYQVGLYSDRKLIGIGWGESVEVAKNTAAIDALQKIYNLNRVKSLA